MKKLIYSFFTLLLIVSSGCKKDFFDINDDPNNPIEENMTPQLILPNVLNAAAAKMATSYDYAAHWMGYWARSGSYGPSNPLENYNLTTTYEQNEWVNGNTSVANPTVSWYNILMDVNTIEKKAQESGQTFYLGIAKVIKAVGFMYLVDQYNNVPYSDAFKGTESISPKYDKGQDIYNDLIVQLEEAKQLFETAEIAANPGIQEADIMFGGDATMWKKLANTQYLKMLLRQSEILGSAPSADLAKINDGTGFLMAGESANVDPGYTVNQYQQNPFYGAYKNDHNGEPIDDFNRANNYILNKYRTSDDIRYQYVFSAARTPISGNRYFGYDFGLVDNNPDQPKAANSSDVAGPGLAKSPTQPQWFFTSVESLFLQAEAVQRGWITGSAQEAYESAVTESFVWLGASRTDNGVTLAPDKTAELYLSQAGNWNTSPNKLSLIIGQKYLALCGVNNFEAWSDYRRLGYPSDVPLSLSPSRNGRLIPVRLLYPQSEYAYNGANVQAEGTIDAQTSKVFWDK